MSDTIVSAECRNLVDEQMADRDTGIVSRWNGILNILLEHNVAYERHVHVDELFTHPKNRGGLGLNQHNVQKNITDITTVGADISKLSHACAFEMSTVPGRRDKQMHFNLNLIEQAKGKLAPPTGKERYLTISTGHTAAGCRAIKYGCHSKPAKITDASGKLNFDMATKKDNALKSMILSGWKFVIIPAVVEEIWPSLPALGQQALNATNAIVAECGELEVAATIADYAANTNTAQDADWSEFVEDAKASSPPCRDYIGTIGRYTQQFGGGHGAPIIRYLDVLAKKYGENKRLGQEFFESITKLAIPSDHTIYPFIRAGCIVTNITSDKVQDGFARFIEKKDIERLKSKALKSKVEAAEAALANAWAQVGVKINCGQISQNTGYQHYGVFSARVTMYVLGNGKAGFEQTEYKNLTELSQKFETAIGYCNEPEEAAPAGPPEQQSSSSKQGPVTFAQTSDPTWIAQERGYKVDLNYTLNGSPKLFKLMAFVATGAKMKEAPLFDQEGMDIIVPFDELKLWTEYKGNVPVEVPTPIIARGVDNERLKGEVMKSEIFLKLTSLAADHKDDEANLKYAFFPSAVFVDRSIEKKGGLTLVPCTDSASKIVSKSSNGMSVIHNGVTMFIEAPVKPNGAKQSDWTNAALLIGFWWIGETTDTDKANMEYKVIGHEGGKFTVAKNTKKLKPFDKLMVLKTKVTKETKLPEHYAAAPKGDKPGVQDNKKMRTS